MYKLLLVLDGPEKAGKTTILNQLAESLHGYGISVARHKWTGPAVPDESEYLVTAMNWLGSADNSQVCLWDRGWPSEYVYGTLLHQPRKMAGSPLAPLWETALNPCLMKIIALGPSSKQLKAMRSADDLPVKPEDERQLFTTWAGFNGWYTWANSWQPPHYTRDMRDLVQSVINSLAAQKPLLTFSRQGSAWRG